MVRTDCRNARVCATRCRGFTLVELITVAAIISVLVAILLPAIASARRTAKRIQCASNLRQICTALQGYATEYRGKYPANFGMTADDFWYGPNVLGSWVSAQVITGAESKGMSGGVMACPEDERGQRSFAMNFWASSFTGYVPSPPGGRFWSANVENSSSMILVVERWSYLTQGTDAVTPGYWAPACAGLAGATPGQRFGGGIAPPALAGRWGRVNCELPFMRHGGNGTAAVARGGCVNIGYADGHVATKSQDELVDMATGLSTLDSLWSPADPQLQ